MKTKLFYILSLFCFMACQESEIELETDKDSIVELKGVEATIYGGTTTRAAALDKENYVGRNVFVNADQMVLTTIKRTPQPSLSPAVTSIPSFSYHGIVYNHVVGAGQTSGGWNRDDSFGSTEESTMGVPEKIYWSDAANWHTYIGYSLPLQSFTWKKRDGSSVPVTSGIAFDWNCVKVYEGGDNNEGIDTYYGSLGDPTVVQTTDASGNIINFIDHTDSTKIVFDDLLLTYDDKKVAETGGSVAKLYYHHALANVRVIVNISGFSATSESADARSIVENMVLKNMLTMYKWNQLSYGAAALNETYDSPKLADIYTNLPSGHTVPTWDQKKDTHLWIPRPNGTGTGVGKQFVFYGLAVPTTMAANTLNLEFSVKYQDPMNPWLDPNAAKPSQPNMKEHTYKATLTQSIEFRAGYCTTINISLNHSNEEMTVGAEYMEWQFIDTPDEGELKKNSTFVTHTDRNKVTIFGDDRADADDATWLYVDEENDNELRDIYGHRGTYEDPFIISTAEQLLSFAYEVRGTSRHDNIKYKNIVTDEEVTLSANQAFDFTGYYVKLDADITMQLSADVKHDANGFYTYKSDGTKDYTMNTDGTGVTWIGIGDGSNKFNGIFLGSGRHINSLYGAPFFSEIGSFAVVDKVNFSNIISVVGSGVVADVNNGLICGCNVEGNVEQAQPTGAGTSYCGSFVGENKSFIVACTHVGQVSGYGYVGGLVGHNEGAIVASYHSGLVEFGKNATDDQKKNIGGSTGLKDETKSIIYSCYQNSDYIKHTPDLKPCRAAWPLTTAQMQSDDFVNSSAEKLFDIDPSTPEDGYTVYIEGAQKHYSLNNALQLFAEWVNTKASLNTNVELPCHTFTASQVKVLNNLFSKAGTDGKRIPAHLYKYSPGAYPKVE